MERRKQKKHLITIIMMFLAISAMNFALPQRADAAEPTVKIGGVDISRYNDNEPHAYNSRQPAITGWTAGKFKLSTDKKTLYIENFKYSGTNIGISSTEDLTIVTSGTNTFTCGNACGIFLGASDDDRKMLTIGSASEGTLELNSNSERNYAVDVGSFSMSAGIVNTSADLRCNGHFTVSGGDLDVSGGVYVDDEASISGGKVSVSGVFNVVRWKDIESDDEVEEVLIPGDLKATGGTLTVGTLIDVKDLTINRAGVTVSNGRVVASNDLSVSKGTLTVTNTSKYGSGVFVTNDAEISGTGNVTASVNNSDAFSAANLTMNGGTLKVTNNCFPDSDTGSHPALVTNTIDVKSGTIIATANGSGGTAIRVRNDLTVSGGKVTGRASGYSGLSATGVSATDIVMTGGTIDGTGAGCGVGASNINISGGTILGEKTSDDWKGSGVSAIESFTMTGGKVSGKGDPGWAIHAQLDKTELGPDIWLSEPAGGVTSYHKYMGSAQTGFLEEYDANGDKSETATLQKVSSISVRTAPTTTLYKEDYFDPDGLVLELTFEDGTTSMLGYYGPNPYREGVVSFDCADQSLDEPLEPGEHEVEVTCLNHTDTFTINVKDVGTTTLSGTASSNSQTLNWDPVDGVQGYQVYGRNAGKNDYELMRTSRVCTIDITGMQPGETWEYYVVPVRRSTSGSTVYGGNSNVVRLTTDISAPEIKPPQGEEPDGTAFGLLQARAGKATKKSVQIKWKQVPGAKSYVIYGNKCGKKNKYVKITTTTSSALTFKSVAGKKVRKGTYYKFIVYAVDSRGNKITASKTIHVATKGGKVGNDKAVKTAAKKSNVTLGKGKTFRLKAKAIPASRKLKVHRHRRIAYESSNNKVASVSPSGVIKAKGSGTCYVYAYAQNGVFKMIKVTVR